jgi:hypothetical protein
MPAVAAPIFCPRCQRANPDEAGFCYYDGISLRDGASATTELGRDFVFPSGRRCRSFDELVQGCSAEWNSARAMLRQGSLRQFLASVGRMDLASMADRMAAHQDPDLGLDEFLAKLPTRDGTVPKLDITPRRLHLGKLQVGDSRDVTLTVANQGSRLLHGTLKIEGENWVRFGDSEDGHTSTIKTGKTQAVKVHVNTAGLPAGQRYSATLTIITSGGAAEVPVLFDLAPHPFKVPPLDGSTSPRELAGKMKEIPKQVAGLIEDGTIERWFAANGWRYPIQGTPAKGIAGVQQFFEGLGLSKPPPLVLEPAEIILPCHVGETVRGQVTLLTTVKKWVFARVDADVPWLIPQEADVAGAQRVPITFTIQTRGLPGGQEVNGNLLLNANGNQKLKVPVKLQLEAAKDTMLQHVLRLLLIGGLTGFLVRLALLPPDLFARGFLADPPKDYVRSFTLALGWIGFLIGALLMARRRLWRDIPAGLIVGGVTGLALSATLACGIALLDGLPSRMWQLLTGGGTWPFGWTVSAFLGWSLLGAAAALLAQALGQAGRSLVSLLRQGYVTVARWLRLGPVERFLEF